jgi:hypothetical protein
MILGAIRVLAGPGEPNRAHQLREVMSSQKKTKVAILATFIF